ncbi:MAG: hypothetical protein EA392_14950 [Cryomorphaceae bacterium]|nr:MAG: hypothetical protein EA392_14950 [Cryomorphaceae bacterium]
MQTKALGHIADGMLGVVGRADVLRQYHQTLHFVQSDIMVQRTRITYIPGSSDAMSGMHLMKLSL